MARTKQSARQAVAEQTSRLEIDPVMAKRDLGVDHEELEVYPEANEINMRRCENI
jgi:hypothetical protein